MIKLTRLDGSEMYLNPDLIELIEESPDTHITLLNGNRFLVLEKTVVITESIVVFKAKIMRRALTGLNQGFLRKHLLKDCLTASTPGDSN